MNQSSYYVYNKFEIGFVLVQHFNIKRKGYLWL
nr:MAG TPA: hypothetical protein [Caudoviricetes sp.]